MAKNGNGQPAPVMGGDDGYLYVRGIEDKLLNAYLETYSARIEGYKVEPGTTPNGNEYINVTFKVSFPTCDNEANCSMWAYFIAKAAHASAASSKLRTWSQRLPDGIGWAVFVSWSIWPNVRYMESKRQGKAGF